jgi:hypothetical protein
VPNNYYQQPPAASPFTAPSYGTGGTPAASTAPGLGQTSSQSNFSLAARSDNSSDELNWQKVTTKPAIGAGGTIHPNTTLTTIRAPNAAAANGNQPVEISQLPQRPGYTPLPTAPVAGGVNPAFPPLNNVSHPGDPWRGR